MTVPSWITLAVATVWLAGCAASPVATINKPVPTPVVQRAAPATTQLTRRPFLLHLPGVGGTRSIDQAVVRGFRQGGFTGDIEIYDWTEGDSGIPALRATERNRRQAQLIADLIVARHRAHPDEAIYLTCHSGGAGLAVWALECLPDEVEVQSLLFMSPALSPSYDLTRALRHVAGRAYVFTSLLDNLVLGYGTRMFGTIDGIRTDAAGQVGFVQPPGADPTQYRKLVWFQYIDAWTRYRNLGDHVGGMTRAFGSGVLAPLLLSGEMPTSPTPVRFAAPGNDVRLPVTTNQSIIGKDVK